ncbi:MAG: hypothetical protein Q7V31_12105 [Parvibaculum sp.]|uniref:hypothetical protein n=1 Tax=Parvibaculum sp. TaxID=2024848 RepID=UPI002726166D|nr:hypothetical protein [Parvibaculum sp.]MDO8839660.1 hypothetical protein [Parvibaculum sp.]
MRTVLIDGDIAAFRIAVAAERAVKWNDNLWTLHAEEQPAIARLHDNIAFIVNACDADAAIVALTDTENFRYGILPTYKGNRKDVRKPMLLPTLRQVLIDDYSAMVRPGLEGDDILGIVSTSSVICKGERIIWSLDKDMYTIPGLFCRSVTENGKAIITDVSEADADRFHLFQTLTGDATDGYSGCPGVGPKAANEILDEPLLYEPFEKTITRGKNKGTTQTVWEPTRACSTWEAVVSQYRRAGLSEGVALQNARVARILRAADYNFKKKEPILWNPPA